MSYPEGICEFDPRAPWNQAPAYENEICGHCLDVVEIRRLDGLTLYACSATDPLEEVKFDSEACCIRVLEQYMTEKWNTRVERTCEAVAEEPAPFAGWVCSECEQPLDKAYNYCPNCGAKVVKQDANV